MVYAKIRRRFHSPISSADAVLALSIPKFIVSNPG